MRELGAKLTSRRSGATEAPRNTAEKEKKTAKSREGQGSPEAGEPAGLAAARIAAEAALGKKAEEVMILDVRGLTTYADYFVLATGTSDRQVMAIADSIEETMKKAGHRPIGTEGYTQGHWVLIDFGDVVAHVFYEDTRNLYDIEGLWADAPRIFVE